jgi:hypothetical protein
MNNNSEKLGFDLIKTKYIPKSRKRAKAKTSENALIFSKKIIAMLEDKVKTHNEKNIKQITLSDLKKAYKNGFNNSENLNKEALAHVNLMLRISQGEANQIFKNFKSTVFEISGSEFIIKGDLIPGELDYKQAEEDIINNDLKDFNFKSLEELYLEDEEDRVTYGFNID